MSFSRVFFFFFLLLNGFNSNAQKVFGTILSRDNIPIPFCTIHAEGSSISTLSNSKGEYSIHLPFGTNTILFNHIGYKSFKKSVEIGRADTRLDILMSFNEITLQEVVVSATNQDPANQIIQNAIDSRDFHKNLIDSSTSNVYIKGLIQLKKFPKVFLGQRIDFEDGDTAKQKTIFLSETIADILYRKNDKLRINIKSTKVSGQSDGLGFSNPQLISFYENNVMLSPSLNPRGFISPIADGAFNFYEYKYLGAFFENGKIINKIEVIPKRKWEPLFNGFIQIVEDEWVIHSLKLELTKESQLEFANKITIEQLYREYAKDIWTISTQSIFPEVNFMGFDADGYFISLFSAYKINADFDNIHFGRTLMKYDANATKKTSSYWDSIRPIPLLLKEVEDYRKKDSLEQKRKDPHYLDSLDRIQNRITFSGLILNGQVFNHRSSKSTFEYDPAIKSISFNTVEGWTGQFAGTYSTKKYPFASIKLTPVVRYGFANRHLNIFFRSTWSFNKTKPAELEFGFGKKVFQYNNANPVPKLMNTFSTLLNGYNYLKIYESNFIHLSYKKEIIPGLKIQPFIDFQKRIPLSNSSSFHLWGDASKYANITPNFPIESNLPTMLKHNAVSSGFAIQFIPNAYNIELPDKSFTVNSNSPILSFEYRKGIPHFLNSNVDYDRWNFSISDILKLKLAGEIRYKFKTGGFIHSSSVEFPDFNHIAGNRTRQASPYLESLQIAPFYAFSTSAQNYSALFVEYALNGLITNKIPIVKKLNTRLIIGTNAIFITKDKRYVELFSGIDNIFKFFRVDYIIGIQPKLPVSYGIRIGIKGFSNLFTEY
jgi:hypothetical protein